MTDQDVIQLAREAYRQGRLRDAENLLTKLLGDQPEQLPTEVAGPAWELLGWVWHDLGCFLKSADAIENASLIRPVRDETRIALASCYAALRRTELARDLYLQLAIRRQLSMPLMLEIAAGLESIDLPESAMQVCEWAIESDDTIAQAYYDMGFYSARSGKPLYITEALTQRALQLEPSNVHFRTGLASLLIQLKRPEEAIEVFSQVTVEQISSIHCKTCLGRIINLLRKQRRCLSIIPPCVQRLEQLCHRREGEEIQS